MSLASSYHIISTPFSHIWNRHRRGQEKQHSPFHHILLLISVPFSPFQSYSETYYKHCCDHHWIFAATVTALSRHDGIESQNLRRGLHQVMRRSVMMPRKMREGVIHLYKWVGRCWCYARWGVTVSNLLAPGDPLLQVGPDTQYTNAQMRCQSSVTFSKWGCPDAIK